MIRITYLAMILTITAAWIAVRAAVALRNRSVNLKRELLLLTVYVSIVVIARFTFYPFNSVEPLTINFQRLTPIKANLVPFTTLFDEYDGWLLNLIGNVLMFIPVGVFWPLCFKKLDSIWKVTLAGCGFSLIIELLQLLCRFRTTDINDLILNTLGAFLGALGYFLIKKQIKRKKTEHL